MGTLKGIEVPWIDASGMQFPGVLVEASLIPRPLTDLSRSRGEKSGEGLVPIERLHVTSQGTWLPLILMLQSWNFMVILEAQVTQICSMNILRLITDFIKMSKVSFLSMEFYGAWQLLATHHRTPYFYGMYCSDCQLWIALCDLAEAKNQNYIVYMVQPLRWAGPGSYSDHWYRILFAAWSALFHKN